MCSVDLLRISDAQFCMSLQLCAHRTSAPFTSARSAATFSLLPVPTHFAGSPILLPCAERPARRAASCQQWLRVRLPWRPFTDVPASSSSISRNSRPPRLARPVPPGDDGNEPCRRNHALHKPLTQPARSSCARRPPVGPPRLRRAFSPDPFPGRPRRLPTALLPGGTRDRAVADRADRAATITRPRSDQRELAPGAPSRQSRQPDMDGGKRSHGNQILIGPVDRVQAYRAHALADANDARAHRGHHGRVHALPRALLRLSGDTRFAAA